MCGYQNYERGDIVRILIISKVSTFLISIMMMAMAILLCCSSQAQAVQSGDYTYTLTDGKAQITKYTGTGGVVAIPSTLGGSPVTSIGKSAFESCFSITKISIPQGVTSIGDCAFVYCSGLASITFNSPTTTIYDSTDTIPAITKIIGYDPSTAKNYATKFNRGFKDITSTSDDITWNKRTSGITNDLYGVTYGNNSFVIVGGNGKILSSSDGITWTSRTSGITSWLNKVTYGNNLFVVVGNNGTILTSEDGITWTSRTSGTTDDLNGVTYGKNNFVAVGGDFEGRTILTSVDGVTWIQRTLGTSENILYDQSLYGVTYGNNKFIAVGHNIIFDSVDGITWTNQTLNRTSCSLREVTYINNSFVALGSDYEGTKYGTYVYGVILNSTDGITWTTRKSPTQSGFNGITFGKNCFVGVGSLILTSPDIINWTIEESGAANLRNGVTYGNNTFVAVGKGGEILQSNPLEVIDSTPDFSGMTEMKTTQSIVSPSKEWTIKLSGLVNESSLNGRIYVTNSQGTQQVTTCSVSTVNGLSQIKVNPTNNYTLGDYILWVKDIESVKGTKNKNQVYLKFTVQ